MELEIVEALQPFKHHDPPRSFAQSHPLSLLRDLSNGDKHQLMPVALAGHKFTPDGPAEHHVLHQLAREDGYAEIGAIRVASTRGIINGLVTSTDLDRMEYMRLQFKPPVSEIGPEVTMSLGNALEASVVGPEPLIVLPDLRTILDEVKLAVRLLEPALLGKPYWV